MKIPLSWLAEFIDLPTRDPEELGQALMSLGHEVEGWEELRPSFDDVVVARVTEVRPHPDADKVRITLVDDGSGEPLEVVCGAWNFEAGAVVPFARVGAKLGLDDEPVEIGRRTVRGVASNGMICSARELGLGEDAAGIMVLDRLGVAGPEDVGRHLVEVLPLPDLVVDLTITPNRPDAMSLLGIARELSAFYEVPVREPDTSLEEVPPVTRVEVRVDDPDGCPRFVAREVSGVSVAPSPLLVQHRLRAAGIRPISNVVDATNYVMLELGHPIHAFDLDRLAEERLTIRRAQPGETLRTLDGIDRSLQPDDILVADSTGPVALAGVMGGASTEVSDETRRVLVEAAHWDPPSVSATAHRLGLRSEASARFERGVDPNLSRAAADRAAALIARLAGGVVHEGVRDIYPVSIEPTVIVLALGEVHRILGVDFALEQVATLLTRLRFGVRQLDESRLEVTVPTFRPDITRPIDLVEEVARLHGYESFPSLLRMGPGGALSFEQRAERDLRDVLVGAGYSEAQTLSFLGQADLDLLRLPEDDRRRRGIVVTNPLRDEERVLRTTLLPGLLRAAAGNVGRGTGDVSLFEIGKVFLPEPSPLDPRIPHQPDRLAFLAVGRRGSGGIRGAQRPVDVYEATALVRLLASGRGVDLALRPARPPAFHPGRAAEVLVDGAPIGSVGEVHPAVARDFGLSGRLAAGELDLAPLLGSEQLWQLRPVSPYPPVVFDLAFDVGPSVLASELLTRLGEAIDDELENIEVFDEFTGPGLEAGRRSLAFRLTLRGVDRTLSDEDLGPVRRRAVAAVEQSLDARLRGSV